MADPLVKALDNYVVFEPGQDERFLNQKETIEWLKGWLKSFEKLPKDLAEKNSLDEASMHLLDTACDLEIKQGFQIQWFAIRLDPKDF